MILTLRTDWAELPYSATGLQRTFVHELGHFLGLDNYSTSCSVWDAAMQDQFVCTQSNPAVMDDVTINDSIPVTNSTSGGNTTLVAGSRLG